MAWSMTFEYDARNDVVTAHFTDCVLASEEDVLRWRREVEAHLSKYPGMDGLVVKFAAGRIFGKERREVLEHYTHRSYRYGGDEMTRMFVLTSGAINGAAVNHYGTRDEALAALKAEREALRRRGFAPFGGGFAGSKA